MASSTRIETQTAIRAKGVMNDAPPSPASSRGSSRRSQGGAKARLHVLKTRSSEPRRERDIPPGGGPGGPPLDATGTGRRTSPRGGRNRPASVPPHRPAPPQPGMIGREDGGCRVDRRGAIRRRKASPGGPHHAGLRRAVPPYGRRGRGPVSILLRRVARGTLLVPRRNGTPPSPGRSHAGRCGAAIKP